MCVGKGCRVPDEEDGDACVVLRALEAEVILKTVKSSLGDGIPIEL